MTLAAISKQPTIACTPEDLFDDSVDVRDQVCLGEAVARRTGVVPDRSDR